MHTPHTSAARIELLEVGRGLAALCVTMLHAATAMAPVQYSGAIGFNGFFKLGFLGVDFFFILSGFIILYVHWADINSPKYARRYVMRRLIRVFPTYWIILAFTLGFNLLFQSEKITVTALSTLQQTSLTAQNLWLGVAWSLQHELIFYGLFLIIIVTRNIGILIFGLWFCSILILKMFAPHFYDYTIQFFAPNQNRTFYLIFLHPANLDFLLGMSIALCSLKTPRYLPYLISLYSILFLAGVAVMEWRHFDWDSFWRFPWTGCGFAALLGLMVISSKYIPTVPRAFTYLGTISYSLYLIHLLPISIVYAGLARLGIYKALPEALVFLMAIVAAIATASASYYGLEKPIIARFQRRFS
jgi:exopolysaccharide production protein ExoZ